MEHAARDADQPPIQFDYRGFAELFDYWNSVRNDGAVPSLRDFDLLGIPHLLQEIAISEIRSPSDIHIRFMGPAIVERYGYDPTGKNSLLNQSEDIRDAVGQWYSQLVAHPCGAVARFTSIYMSGREAAAESLFLPLQAEGRPCFINLARVTEFMEWKAISPLTVTAARVLDFEWIDLGFGVPLAPKSTV